LSGATSLKGKVAFDSSVLVEIFSDSELGKSIYSRLQGEDVTVFTSQVNLAEATYVTCRKVGHDKARAAAKDLLDSGYIILEENPGIHQIASEIKCERGISLADCYTFAVARVAGASPVFAREESELTREARKRPFETPPIFLS
jgi:uncharacterized protein